MILLLKLLTHFFFLRNFRLKDMPSLSSSEVNTAPLSIPFVFFFKASLIIKCEVWGWFEGEKGEGEGKDECKIQDK